MPVAPHPVVNGGIYLALLTFKPQFAILVPVALLAGRNWQALAAMVLTTLALIGLSVLLFGFDPWYGYLHVILPNQRLLIEAPMDSEKINMFLTITPFIAARFIGLPIFLAYGLAGACLIAVIAAVAYVFAYPEAKNLRAPVLLTAVFFATPYAFVTDMTILSAAVILMLAAKGGGGYATAFPYEICLSCCQLAATGFSGVLQLCPFADWHYPNCFAAGPATPLDCRKLHIPFNG